MMKIVRLRMALLVPVVAVGAACSDAMGPEQHPPVSALAARGPGSMGYGNGRRHEVESVTTFTIRPNRDDRFGVGSHVLIVPAHAICDPALSSYGPGTWNQPCEPLRHPIKVTAVTWRDSHGMPRVHFSPQLRFSPNKTVELWMKDRAVKAGGDFTILYCPDGASECVDESLSDPSLTSFVIQKSGTVYRRIKHFSVYNLAAESWMAPADEAYEAY
jgi:hypothetical protein